MSSDLEKIELFLNKQVKNSKVCFIMGQSGSGKTVFSSSLRGQPTDQVYNQEKEYKQVVLAQPEKQNQFKSKLLDLPILFHTFKVNNIVYIDMPSIFQKGESKKIFLSLLFFNLALKKSKVVSLIIMLPFQYCTNNEQMFKFYKLFQTFFDHNALQYRQFCESINLVFSKIQDEDDKQTFLQVFDALTLKQQKDYNGQNINSFKSALQQDRIHLFFNKISDEDQGNDRRKQVQNKLNFHAFNPIMKFKQGFNFVIEKNIDEDKDNFYQYLSQVYLTLQKLIKAQFQLLVLTFHLSLIQKQQIQQSINQKINFLQYNIDISQIQNYQTNPQFCLQILSFIQNNIKNINDPITFIQSILAHQKIKIKGLHYQILGDIYNILQYFNNFQQPLSNDHIIKCIRCGYQKIMSDNFVKIQKKNDTNQYYKDLEQIYGGDKQDQQDDQQQFEYKQRNYIEIQKLSDVDKFFNQSNGKIQKSKIKKNSDYEQVQKLFSDVQKSKDRKNCLQNLKKILIKYMQLQATLLVYLELGNLQNIQKFLNQYYFHILQAKDTNNFSKSHFQTLIKYVIKYKKFQQKNQDIVKKSCISILNRCFNYLITQQVDNQQQFIHLQQQLCSTIQDIQDDNYSDTTSLTSLISTSDDSKKKNYVVNKSIAHSVVDQSPNVDMKKKKAKTQVVQLNESKNLQYLKYLKYQGKKKIIQRIKKKEDFLANGKNIFFQKQYQRFSKYC